MKYIIIGTNRRGSRSRQIGNLVQKIYRDLGEEVGIVDLAELPLHELTGEQYGQKIDSTTGHAIATITGASGLIMIVPEYNGSLPGALKYFIDHWQYPESFEHRPICLIGLGGMFAGLRPVEHLQGILGYRNAFLFPQRVFLQNVWASLKDGDILDKVTKDLLIRQAEDFQKFTAALESVGLDANSLNRMRIAPAPKI